MSNSDELERRLRVSIATVLKRWSVSEEYPYYMHMFFEIANNGAAIGRELGRAEALEEAAAAAHPPHTDYQPDGCKHLCSLCRTHRRIRDAIRALARKS